MSYVLINGKRYYKDDRTGRTTMDNVSQAEADQRAQRTQSAVRPSVTNPPNPAAGNSRTTNGAGSSTIHTGFPWKTIIICAVITMVIGAFLYNRSHVSSAEEAITNYMNAQQANAASDTAEAESVFMMQDQETDAGGGQMDLTDESGAQAAYLMPDSAERYLEASDIENYSHDEVQLIINEIYARHGREFHSRKNIDYFSAQGWYEPVSGKSDEEIVSEFNEFEKANVDLLSEYL